MIDLMGSHYTTTYVTIGFVKKKSWGCAMACELCSDEVQNLEYNLAKTETMWRMEKLKNKLLLAVMERLATSTEVPHWVRDDAARVMRDVAQI